MTLVQTIIVTQLTLFVTFRVYVYIARRRLRKFVQNMTLREVETLYTMRGIMQIEVEFITMSMYPVTCSRHIHYWVHDKPTITDTHVIITDGGKKLRTIKRADVLSLVWVGYGRLL